MQDTRQGALLDIRRKSSEMVTTYEVTDGPIVESISTDFTGKPKRMRVTRVVVRVLDNGYTEVDVRGEYVTKDDRAKSGDWAAAGEAFTDQVREWLMSR